MIRLYEFNTTIATTARIAPTVLAKTSIISALLVNVIYCCINSIEIPNKSEKTKDQSNGLTLLELLNFFLKYKNQRVVNTK